ncbi:unnamed protein product [Phytophthora fragariaefolia]|uniref:Unnamed protein product n=1 Tax=Phytophthora fragariaefolia TaxID=1490495 RepID=A0A9W6XTD6_9STRA|nr:unnamed protein product [Phytophthora fragariaefolia]
MGDRHERNLPLDWFTVSRIGYDVDSWVLHSGAAEFRCLDGRKQVKGILAEDKTEFWAAVGSTRFSASFDAENASKRCRRSHIFYGNDWDTLRPSQLTPQKPRAGWCKHELLSRSICTGFMHQSLALYSITYTIYGIIGDINLIIRQMQQRRMPKAHHLQGCYSQCWLLADRLTVTSWVHHLRQYNKMTDKLANLAMDSKKSIQVTPRDIPKLPLSRSPVLELQGDVDYWIDHVPDQEGTSRAPDITGTH